MEYRFNVTINEKDYLDYNKFWQFRSPYGKKQIRNIRIYLLILFVLYALYRFFRTDFSADGVFSILPMLLLCLFFQIFLKGFFSLILNLHIKSLKKRGKPGYSPESVLEFSENCFREITSDNKTECKYSTVERISIVDNKNMYIHINSMASYILPLSCFESKEQYDGFLQFIKTKCANIDFY